MNKTNKIKSSDGFARNFLGLSISLVPASHDASLLPYFHLYLFNFYLLYELPVLISNMTHLYFDSSIFLTLLIFFHLLFLRSVFFCILLSLFIYLFDNYLITWHQFPLYRILCLTSRRRVFLFFQNS